MRFRLLLLVWFGIVCLRPASAQTVTDERVWWNATAQERAGTASPWRWYVEVQGRFRDGVSDVDQLILRPAVGIDLTSRSSLWLGYGYIATYLPGGDTLPEHRVWQQHLWNVPVQALGGVFQSRARLEQRAIDGNDRLAWRAREFVRLTRPISPRAGLAIVVWDEVFLHLNDTARTAGGFDQNRLFAGIGVNAGRGGRFEIGYVNQAIASSAGPDRRHHLVLAFLNLTY